MTVPVGLDLTLAYNSGTENSPVWVSFDTVKDLKSPFEKGKAEAIARLSEFKMYIGTLKSLPLEFNILRDQELDDWDILLSSFTDYETVKMAISDGPIAANGTNYLKADYEVFGFAVNEPLQEASTADVAMDLAYSANVPTYVTVGS